MSNIHEPTVFVVDDDAAVRDSLLILLRSAGISCEEFPSAEGFLSSYSSDRPGCMILDIRMPGTDGLELQQMLIKQGMRMPIIFLTGHGDVPMAVQAIKSGALDFIEKPFREQALIDSVKRAIEQDGLWRKAQSQSQYVKDRLASLSARERQVMELLLQGKTSKMIASELGRSHKTIDVHRANILDKMHVQNVAGLARMLMDAGKPE